DAQEIVLTDLQKELSAAQADRITKQSKYEMAVASPPGALPEILDDVTLKTSQAALADLQGKLAQLKVTFTSNHAEVKKVEAQIAAIEASLQGSRSNVMTRIRNEYEGAQRREALLTTAYTAQAHSMSGKAEETAHYNLLKREVDASRLLYENLLHKLKEASIASALRANNIRVVDRADRPGAPYKPNVSQQVMLGLIGGMIVGVAFIVFREQADRTLQDPGDPACNLGLSLAEINHSVLLIDADMRRPRLHTVFGVSNDHGLSDLLLEKNSLKAEQLADACQPTAVPGLSVLTSGGSRRSASSLLHS